LAVADTPVIVRALAVTEKFALVNEIA